MGIPFLRIVVITWCDTIAIPYYDDGIGWLGLFLSLLDMNKTVRRRGETYRRIPLYRNMMA